MNYKGYLSEVLEQPEILLRTLEAYLGDRAGLLEAAAQCLRPGHPLILTGMGSSYYASLAGSIYFGYRGLFSCVKEASEFLHYGLDAVWNDHVLVAVSQSGESVETREVVQSLAGRGLVIGVTNDETSSLGSLSQVVLPLLAGQESSASTKTYVTSVLLLYLLALRSEGEALRRHGAELRRSFQQVQYATEESLKVMPELTSFLREDTVKLTLIGRGPVFSSILHGALLLKETSGTPAEAINGGAFRHGPLEVAGPGHAAVVAAPQGRTQKLSINLALELAEFGSRVLLLTDAPVEERQNLRVFPVPPVSEELSPLVHIAPLEVFAWQMANYLGIDPDAPRRITKVTTRE